MIRVTNVLDMPAPFDVEASNGAGMELSSNYREIFLHRLTSNQVVISVSTTPQTSTPLSSTQLNHIEKNVMSTL